MESVIFSGISRSTRRKSRESTIFSRSVVTRLLIFPMRLLEPELPGCFEASEISDGLDLPLTELPDCMLDELVSEAFSPMWSESTAVDSDEAVGPWL